MSEDFFKQSRGFKNAVQNTSNLFLERCVLLGGWQYLNDMNEWVESTLTFEISKALDS